MFQFDYNAISTHNVKSARAQEKAPSYWQIVVDYFNDDKPAILRLGKMSENKAYQELQKFVGLADLHARENKV